MSDQMNRTPEQRRKNGLRMLLLCLSGLLINTGFAYLARAMALPLYLDNIGSALAAALGGYVPGIAAGFHHEKWDGTGYPCGLKGEEIPLSARIMAVADVFDALVSRRSYKEPFSFEKAMRIIREDSGSRFDPAIADAFCRAGEEVRRVMDSAPEG